MKLKISLLLALAAVFTSNLFAKTIQIQEAEKVAKNFLYITVNKYDDGISYDQIRFTDDFIYKVDGNPVFYAFNTEKGFVIISAEDVFTPVIGYSFESGFEFEQAPANFKGFILNYVDQINYIRENNLIAEPGVAQAWMELREADINNMAISRDRDVQPLLACMWNQGSPYNILCPEDPAGPGGHTWVGCVATAMAQIMYYWRYPLVGTGEHCYIPGHISYGMQCANFGETYYGWEGMINSIDNKNPLPNAELQYHCAVSVNMDFGTDGSGTMSYLVPGSLESYFQYNDAQYLEKKNYSLTNWINLLKAEIDLGHPLYYSGFSSAAGHAFVCDGYQGNNFHFNFGWSGSGNGYFTLTDVGGFNQGQGCVRYFVPSDPAYPYNVTGNVVLTHKSGSFTDGSGPIENYLDNIQASWLIDPQNEFDSIINITLKFKAFDLALGDFVNVYDGSTTSDSLVGSYSGTSLPPDMISSGNKMLITFTTNGSASAKGWYAEYSTTSPVWCNGLTQLIEPSATFDDGSGNFYYQGGAICLWRIAPTYANKITLNFNSFDTEENVDLLKVYDNQTLIATFSGSNIPDPVEATSGNMFITWTTNQSTNMQGWEAYYEVDNVGVPEGTDVKYLQVYPNPASDELNIAFELAEVQNLSIKLVNITGQVVYSETQKQFSGIYHSVIPVRELAGGLYFLNISTGNGSLNKKIVVK